MSKADWLARWLCEKLGKVNGVKEMLIQGQETRELDHATMLPGLPIYCKPANASSCILGYGEFSTLMPGLRRIELGKRGQAGTLVVS